MVAVEHTSGQDWMQTAPLMAAQSWSWVHSVHSAWASETHAVAPPVVSMAQKPLACAQSPISPYDAPVTATAPSPSKIVRMDRRSRPAASPRASASNRRSSMSRPLLVLEEIVRSVAGWQCSNQLRAERPWCSWMPGDVGCGGRNGFELLLVRRNGAYLGSTAVDPLPGAPAG